MKQLCTVVEIIIVISQLLYCSYLSHARHVIKPSNSIDGSKSYENKKLVKQLNSNFTQEILCDKKLLLLPSSLSSMSSSQQEQKQNPGGTHAQRRTPPQAETEPLVRLGMKIQRKKITFVDYGCGMFMI